MKWWKWAAVAAVVAALAVGMAGCGKSKRENVRKIAGAGERSGAGEVKEAPAAPQTPGTPARGTERRVERAAEPMREPARWERRSGEVKTVTLPGGAALEVVWVEGGRFWMGSDDFDPAASGNETPRHEVELTKGFWMGRYEVTQTQWKSVMGSNPARHKGKDLPVERVSFADIGEFMRRVNGSGQGWGIRLPTEAEWEYAARGGRLSKGGWAYSGGGDVSQVGWYSGNSGGTTHEVGLKNGNELGLFDMTGNVWEWCADGYGKYQAARTKDPRGARGGQYRVDRGGGWDSRDGRCRVAGRGWVAPGSRLNNLGFRVVLEGD